MSLFCPCQFHSILFCEIYRGGTRLIYFLDTVPPKMLKSTCPPPICTATALFTMDNSCPWHLSIMITKPLLQNSMCLLQPNVKGEKKESTLAFWSKVLKKIFQKQVSVGIKDQKRVPCFQSGLCRYSAREQRICPNIKPMHKEIPQTLMNFSSKMYKRKFIYLLYVLMLYSSKNSRENISLYHFYWDTAIFEGTRAVPDILYRCSNPQTNKQTRLLENSLLNLPGVMIPSYDSLVKALQSIRGLSSLLSQNFVFHDFNSISSF